MQLVILGGALVVWAVVHSWLASDGVKAWVQKRLGPAAWRGYRLGYNGFAVISAAPVLWLMWRMSDAQLYAIPAPWSVMMDGIRLLAALWAVLTVLQTDALHFAGLAQILARPEAGRLVSTGLYRHVRHPLYLLGLIFLWCSPRMSSNQLMVDAVMTAYLFIGALLEERRLVREFGAAYIEYRARTPMIFPRIRRRPLN